MAVRRFLAVLGVALVAVSCSDSSPVQVEDRGLTPTDASFARAPSTLLTDIPVTGALPGGGTFTGLLDITELGLDDGQLVASGVLTGTATQAGVVTQIVQTFTDIPLDLLGDGSGGRSCKILTLDLGPLNLDLLGLVVDLSAISLDITAVPGPGNLLGNLLCAVAGLLDAGGAIGRIVDLLDRINDLLGALG
ncbi:MAG TPA: hypothetical protein VF746_02655 [Longimicrobium sp.]|jgi:hypothetical protein